MADDVLVDNGGLTDYTTAADDAGGALVQVVKLAYSADGSRTHIPADVDGLRVNVSTLPAVTGTVTANAGTNLNTSTLALEAGGNLAAAAASLSVVDDWDEADRAKVNTIAGQAGVAGGSGVVGATTQRVVLATDVALPAGTNNIGDVDVASIAAGDNNIGNVDVVTLPALPAGTNNIGDVDVLTVPAPLSTTGGGTEATALRVTLANDSTGVVSVDDNGGSLTVDGTVAVSGTVAVTDNASSLTVDAPVGTPVFVRLSDGAAAVTGLEVVSGSGSLTGSGQAVTLTLAGQANATFHLSGTWTATVAFEASNDGFTTSTSIFALRAGDNTISQTVANDTNNDIYRCTVSGFAAVRARCSAYTSGTIGIQARASANTSGVFLNFPIPAGTNNIGDVDVLTMPNVTLAAGTNTNEVVGDVAHDAAVAGNPLVGAGVSIDTDDTAPPNRVSAEGDATRLGVDRDGSAFVRTHGPQIWSYHVNGSSALTDATVKAAPGAGLSLYVTSVTFSSGAATAINAFFEEGASTVLGPFYLEATAGRGMHLVFPTPKKITANTALTITTSAAIAHSVDVMGYTAQG